MTSGLNIYFQTKVKSTISLKDSQNFNNSVNMLTAQIFVDRFVDRNTCFLIISIKTLKNIKPCKSYNLQGFATF